MAKRKIVIQVTMPDAKSRSRAMVLAAKANGVISIGITGDLMDRLEVVGDGIDITGLVKRLRKKLRHAEVLKVEEVKGEKKTEEHRPWGCPAPSPCASYCHTPTPMHMMALYDEERRAADQYCRIL